MSAERKLPRRSTAPAFKGDPVTKDAIYSNRLPLSFFPLWWRNALQVREIALVAPWVATHRLLRMANAGAMPSARDRAEFLRMGHEKGEALTAAGSGMATLWFGLAADFAVQSAARAWQLWLDPWQGWGAVSPFAWMPRPRAKDTRNYQRLLSKAIVPVHRRVAANAKRLGRTR